jgi:AP-2 complex subunit mu-1
MVDIEDVSFHRCVRLGRFEADRSIVFVPPDGIFDLLKFRISDNVNLPFRVMIVADNTSSVCVSYNLKIQATFPQEVGFGCCLFFKCALKGVL